VIGDRNARMHVGRRTESFAIALRQSLAQVVGTRGQLERVALLLERGEHALQRRKDREIRRAARVAGVGREGMMMAICSARSRWRRRTRRDPLGGVLHAPRSARRRGLPPAPGPAAKDGRHDRAVEFGMATAAWPAAIEPARVGLPLAIVWNSSVCSVQYGTSSCCSTCCCGGVVVGRPAESEKPVRLNRSIVARPLAS
jgi:hypothetical protein